MKRIFLLLAIFVGYCSYGQYPPAQPYPQSLPSLQLSDSISLPFLGATDTVVVIALPNGNLAGVLKSSFGGIRNDSAFYELELQIDSTAYNSQYNDSLITLSIDSLNFDTIPIYNWVSLKDSLIEARLDSSMLIVEQNDSILQASIDGYRYPVHIELKASRNLSQMDANTTLYTTGSNSYMISIPSGLSSAIDQEYFYFQSRNTGTINIDASAVLLFDSEGDSVSSITVDAAAALVRTGQDTFYIIDAGMIKTGTGTIESDPVFVSNGVKLSTNQTITDQKTFTNLVVQGGIEITDGNNVAGEDGNWRLLIINGELKAQKLIAGNWRNQSFGSNSPSVPYVALRQWRVDLNNEYGNSTPELGWNKINPTTTELTNANGFTSPGLLDSNNQATSITFTNTTAWQSSTPNVYPAAPDLGGVFSTEIYRGAWEFGSTEVEIRFDNLDDTKFYQIYIIAASSSTNLETTWRANNGSDNIIGPLFNNFGSSANEWHSDPSLSYEYNVQSNGGSISLQFVKSGTYFLSSISGIIVEESAVQK